MRAGLISLAGMGLVLTGFLTAAELPSETVARGFNEIAYTQLHTQLLLPGQSASQAVEVQGPRLSQLAFLYSSPSPDPIPVDLSVRAEGQIIARRRLQLGPTLSVRDREAWWSFQATGDAAPNTWQALARFREVPLPGSPRGTIFVTIAVPLGGKPLIVYWNPAGGGEVPSPEPGGRRYAIRTEYGPSAPALLKGPTFLQRMAHWGSSWLPPPALVALIITTLALLSGLCWHIAGHSN
jgi:hypothetical protein